MKKRLGVLIILAIVAVTAASLCACSPTVMESRYVDRPLSVYGDGFALVEANPAPTSAAEFSDGERLTRKIIIDGRIGGLHSTGMYVPAGERTTIVIPSDMTEAGMRVYVNAHKPNAKFYDLTSAVNVIDPIGGGTLDIYLPFVREGAFDVEISGVVDAPLYRYGIDNPYETKSVENVTAVYDAANIRFYFPSGTSRAGEGAEKAMRWWRSAVKLMDTMTEYDVVEAGNRPVCVFVDDAYEGISHETFDDYGQRVLRVESELFVGATDCGALLSGAAWGLLKELGQLKIEAWKPNLGAVQRAMLEALLTSCVYVTMADGDAGAGGTSWLTDGYDCLAATLSQEEIQNKNYALFVNIMHSFGAEKMREIFDDLAAAEIDDDGAAEAVADVVSDSLGLDVSDYAELFGMQLSDEFKDAHATLAPYVPVQCKYTYGGAEVGFSSGYAVPAGVTARFDFDGAVISPLEGWKVASIEGREGAWRDIGEGSYEYYPSNDALTDDFAVTFERDGVSVKLYGKIAVDVRVGTNRAYHDVPFRDVDEAVKKYKDFSPSQVTATDLARVETGEEANPDAYTFSVCGGSITVDKDGEYTFYLRSSGLCRVDFGVKEYIFNIFRNSLTVNSFTDELKYVIKLEAGRTYYYRLYVLSTKGSGWAELGIDEGGNIVAIGKDYLLYEGFDDGYVVDYDAPVFEMDEYFTAEQFYTSASVGGWKLVDSPETLKGYGGGNMFDGDDETSFRSVSSSGPHRYVIDMGQYTQPDKLILDARMPVDAECRIFIGDTEQNWREVSSFDVVGRKSEFIFEEKIGGRYLALEFTSSSAFSSQIFEIECYKKFPESVVIPNTSSQVVMEGSWQRQGGIVAVNGSVSVNNDKNSAIKYKFYGSAVAMYCAYGPQYGKARVYIDDKEFMTVNLHSDTPAYSKLAFSFDFGEAGEHSVKVLPNKRDTINLDYFTAKLADRPTDESNAVRLWYLMIIPVVLLIAFAVCAALDIKTRLKGRVRKSGNKGCGSGENDAADGDVTDETPVS